MIFNVKRVQRTRMIRTLNRYIRASTDSNTDIRRDQWRIIDTIPTMATLFPPRWVPALYWLYAPGVLCKGVNVQFLATARATASLSPVSMATFCPRS
jgi:hypothetical protein